MIGIVSSRFRVRLAGALIDAGNRMLAAEARRWGLLPRPASWRVPNTP
jgi:hypothetical protein